MEQTPASGGLFDRLINSAFSHPLVVVSLVVLATVAGVVAFRGLPRNVYPDITIPVFTLVTENETMAAEEIETMITRPLEAALNGLPGALQVRSQTTQGLSTVVVEFGLDTEFWRARQFVSERLAQVAAQLPPGSEGPHLASATSRLAEVYEVVVEGEADPVAMREYAEWQLRYALLNVPGVADVLDMGGRLKQYRVTLDPRAMLAREVSLADIESAIEAGNENTAGGFISTGPSEYNVRGIGRYGSLEDIEHTVVSAEDGVPIYLRDVAEVTEGTAIRRGVASKDGKEAVVALVIKQPTADTMTVVRGVEATVAELRTSLPEGLRLVAHFDQTHLIKEALGGVGRAIVIGAVLVVVVLMAFMGNLRITLIVALSLPLAVVITGAILQRLDVGLNTMSLGGLAIAVGIMVDASIIMVENLHHRFSQNGGGGGDRVAIARRAAHEVGRPIAFATLIIVAVFLPLFLMGGIEGLLFRPLALTVGGAMLVSLLLSLTLTPMLGMRLLGGRGGSGEEDVWLMRVVKRTYTPLLELALRNRAVVITLAFGLLIPTAVMLTRVGTDFLPQLDEGSWLISLGTPAETSLEENDRISAYVEGLLLANPNVAAVLRRSGRSERAIGCALPVNLTEFTVNLKPPRERRKPTAELLAEVRAQLGKIPGIAVAFNQPFQMKIDESLQGTPAALQVKVFGSEVSTLAEIGRQIEVVMREVPGVADPRLDQVAGIPQVQVRINREAAARHGIAVSDISEVVSLAVGGEELTQVWQDQRSYGVFVRLPDSERNDLEAIGRIPVRTAAGGTVPLAEVAEVSLAEGPNVIWREAMSRRLSINAGLAGRDLGSVVADIKARLGSIEIPAGYYVAFGGQYQNQQRAMRALVLATVIALAVVFVLLFMALQSGGQAAMILTTVPSAFIGGVASLLIAGETLNVSSAVGFIALFGIAVQNSLVLITQTNQFVAEGHAPEEAIRWASVQRLRPKLMTACCTALGVAPILLSQGVGAEIERPLAVVLVGGLVTSTLFTLLVLPAVYLAAQSAWARLQQAEAQVADQPA